MTVTDIAHSKRREGGFYAPVRRVFDADKKTLQLPGP